MLKSSLRNALIAQLLSPLFLSLMAWGAEKPATCELESKSIVSRSASGVAQVSNLGDIEVKCSVPARPFPTKPGESRNALRATTTSYKISADGSKELVVSEVNDVGGGFDAQREWTIFFVHIPLESADLDTEARRYLAHMDNLLAKEKSMTPPPRTEEAQQRALERLREFVYQHRVGHFLLECGVLDKDQVMGVGVVELEVFFKGRFSDVGLPAVPRQQELNRAMVFVKSATNLMQRLSRLPTAPDVSPLRRGKPVPSTLSHRHHLHIRWCCIHRLRPPGVSVSSTQQLAPNGQLTEILTSPLQQDRSGLAHHSIGLASLWSSKNLPQSDKTLKFPRQMVSIRTCHSPAASSPRNPKLFG